VRDCAIPAVEYFADDGPALGQAEEDFMRDTGDVKLYDELLELLAEEQSLSKGTPTANHAERREYRSERIRELMSRLPSIDEAKS